MDEDCEKLRTAISKYGSFLIKGLSELAARACCNVVDNIYVYAISEKLILGQLVAFVPIMMSYIRVIAM